MKNIITVILITIICIMLLGFTGNRNIANACPSEGPETACNHTIVTPSITTIPTPTIHHHRPGPSN